MEWVALRRDGGEKEGPGGVGRRKKRTRDRGREAALRGLADSLVQAVTPLLRFREICEERAEKRGVAELKDFLDKAENFMNKYKQ